MDNKLKAVVFKQLDSGKNKALTQNILSLRVGEHPRVIRLAIQELIKDGVPVIGSPRGYYIADNIEDCKENLERLMGYIKMLALHHKYLLRATKKLSGQLKMRL